MLIYNPIYNKKPSGAVTNKDSVKFDVFIKENFYFNDFRIIIKNEFTGEYKSESLKFIEKTALFQQFLGMKKVLENS